MSERGKKTGRPRKGHAPLAGNKELERLLVFGEPVMDDDGAAIGFHFPSYRELADRYGVSNSAIAQFSRKHNCMRRREVAQAQLAAKTDAKLVELQAHAMAVDKDHQIRIVDSYLLGFEKALAEGTVRFDNASDFNTMARLRTFLEGGADSRKEINVTLSLESLHERHRRMLKASRESSAEERGELSHSGSRPLPDHPPTLLLDATAEEVSGQFEMTGAAVTDHRAVSGLSPRAIYGHEPAVGSRPPGVPAGSVAGHDGDDVYEGDSGPETGRLDAADDGVDSDS